MLMLSLMADGVQLPPSEIIVAIVTPSVKYKVYKKINHTPQPLSNLMGS